MSFLKEGKHPESVELFVPQEEATLDIILKIIKSNTLLDRCYELLRHEVSPLYLKWRQTMGFGKVLFSKFMLLGAWGYENP